MRMIRKTRNRLLLAGALGFVTALSGLLVSFSRAAEPPTPPGALPPGHLLFATSLHCIACHSKVHAPDGEDISIGYQWRASIMANSSRDPYWQAGIPRGTMDHPAPQAGIQNA